MARIRTLLIFLLLASGLGYAGIKSYIYYQVKASLDDAAAKARPFAQLEYAGISSSLTDAAVRVDDLVVRAFNDELRVASVELRTDGALELLRMVSDPKGEAPDVLELAVQGLELDLEGALLRLVDVAAQAGAQPALAHGPCAGRLTFGPRELRAMGYRRLRSDLRLRMDASHRDGGVDLELHAGTEDMGDLRMQLRVSGMRTSLARLPRAEEVLLKGLEIVYRDRAYVRRVVEFCAREAEGGVEGHIQAVLGADDRYYMHTWGIVPGAELRAGYGAFLREPREVRVVAAPASPVEVATLHLYDPDDLVALLGLQVAFNGDTVAHPTFRVRPELLQAFGAASRPGRVGGTPAAQAGPASERSDRVPAPRFRPVDKADLARYVGRTVRLVTAEQAREGVLMASDGERAVVERRMYGGSMSVPVPLAQIVTAEVLLP